jgi:hypothetical protein
MSLPVNTLSRNLTLAFLFLHVCLHWLACSALLVCYRVCKYDDTWALRFEWSKAGLEQDIVRKYKRRSARKKNGGLQHNALNEKSGINSSHQHTAHDDFLLKAAVISPSELQ